MRLSVNLNICSPFIPGKPCGPDSPGLPSNPGCPGGPSAPLSPLAPGSPANQPKGHLSLLNPPEYYEPNCELYFKLSFITQPIV